MARKAPFGALALGLFFSVGCHISGSAHRGYPPPPPDAGGGLYVWETNYSDGGIVYELDAVFPNPSWKSHVCDGAQDTEGSCCFFAGQSVSEANRIVPQGSVGPITLTDTTTATTIGTLDYVGWHDGYPSVDWQTPAYHPGDTLLLSAPGDQLFPFNVSGVAPMHISGVTPAWSAPINIPRSSDFTLGWTPDPSAQTMRFLAFAQGNDGPHGYIWCETPDDAGTVTIASKLLQHFDGGDSCSFCVFARTNDTVQDGGVNLRIETSVTDTPVYQATFQ